MTTYGNTSLPDRRGRASKVPDEIRRVCDYTYANNVYAEEPFHPESEAAHIYTRVLRIYARQLNKKIVSQYIVRDGKYILQFQMKDKIKYKKRVTE